MKEKTNYKPLIYDETITDLFECFPEVWDKTDLWIYKTFKRHLVYKELYWVGLFLWLTFVFWFPFSLGALSEIVHWITKYDISRDSYLMYCDWATNGLLAMCWFSFTTPVTLPVSIFIGCVIHPILLKKMMFNSFNKYHYDEEIAIILDHSEELEHSVSAGAFSGSILSRIL